MKIGFIGAGKMARAIAEGAVRGNFTKGADVLCSSRSRESGANFLNLVPGSRWTNDNRQVIQFGQLVVIAVKPNQIDQALSSLKEFSDKKIILSLAAGISLAQLGNYFSSTARLFRVMPNTPAQIGSGAIAYAAGPTVNSSDPALIAQLLGRLGKIWLVNENQMAAITALSGSGPAYVFHFLDALIRGAVSLGLDEKLARELALQTVLGSAELAAQSSLTPMDLAAQVKSPRGTTLAGCAVLEDKDALNDLMARCLAAAKARAEALARGEP